MARSWVELPGHGILVSQFMGCIFLPLGTKTGLPLPLARGQSTLCEFPNSAWLHNVVCGGRY